MVPAATACVNGLNAEEHALTGPTNTPVTLTSPLPTDPLLNSWQLAQSSSGAEGIQRIQASSTLSAACHGHSRVKRVIASGIGWAENSNEVTMPKLPPPPPRQAQ